MMIPLIQIKVVIILFNSEYNCQDLLAER
jgi:hypothetical protein